MVLMQKLPSTASAAAYPTTSIQDISLGAPSVRQHADFYPLSDFFRVNIFTLQEFL